MNRAQNYVNDWSKGYASPTKGRNELRPYVGINNPLFQRKNIVCYKKRFTTSFV